MLDVRNELLEIEEESESFRTASPVPEAPRSRSAMTGALAAALLVVTAAALAASGNVTLFSCRQRAWSR